MAAVFTPKATLIGRATLLAAALLFSSVIGWWWLAPRTDWARRVGFHFDQPVPFSHQHHVAGLGIDCRFCHSSVEVSSRAGMPPTWTCMTCHSQIWTNADLLAPVRQSLADDKPIVWGRVNNLPDYVYFNHSIHIAKGVGCSSCHGAGGQHAAHLQGSLADHAVLPGLPPRSRRRSCARESAIYDTEWQRTADTPSPAGAGGALRRSRPRPDGLLDMPSMNSALHGNGADGSRTRS